MRPSLVRIKPQYITDTTNKFSSASTTLIPFALRVQALPRSRPQLTLGPRVTRRTWMAQNLPKLSDWEQVSPNIIRILAGNPSKFTLQGTNTYLVGRGPSRLLVDSGQGERAWLDSLRSVLAAQPEPTTVSTCVLTHWHHDHVGGVKDLETLCPGVKVYKNAPTLNPDGILDPERVIDIVDGQRFSVATATDKVPFEVQAIHTPGHAKDHMVLQIVSSDDSAEVGALFTADNVLGHGTAVFEDLALYLQSLDRMKRRVIESAEASKATTKKAYPGHGAVIEDAVSKIDEYIAHRRMREEEALNVLRYGTVKAPQTHAAIVHDSLTREGDGSSDSETDASSTARLTAKLTAAKELAPGKEWSSLEMVKVIYRHYPENLYAPAEFGLLMVLEKLRRDGKVVKLEGGSSSGAGTGAGASVGTEGIRWRVSEKATL